MNRADYLEAFEAITDRMLDTTRRKNGDYADGDDAFQNFRMVEHAGIATVEQGILTRMSDKFQRAANLLQPGREAQVKDESVEDTLIDNAVYSIILLIYRRSKKPQQLASAEALEEARAVGSKAMRGLLSVSEFEEGVR